MRNTIGLRNNRAGDDDPARDGAALHRGHFYAGSLDGAGAKLRQAPFLRIALGSGTGLLRWPGRHRRLLKRRQTPYQQASQQKAGGDADGQHAQTTDHDVYSLRALRSHRAAVEGDRPLWPATTSTACPPMSAHFRREAEPKLWVS